MAVLVATSGYGAMRIRERWLAGAPRAPMTVTLMVASVAGLGLGAWTVLGPTASSEEISRMLLAPAEARTTAAVRRFAVTVLGARMLQPEPRVGAARAAVPSGPGPADTVSARALPPRPMR
jgi:hypothetical protein